MFFSLNSHSFFVQRNALVVVADTVVPAVFGKVEGIVNQAWKNFPFLKKIQERFDLSVSPSVKKITGFTGNVAILSGKVAFQGLLCLDELLDFANFRGTKDPAASIAKSCQRLCSHDKNLADCLDFLSDQAAHHYNAHSESIKTKLHKVVEDYFYEPDGDEDDDNPNLYPNIYPILVMKSTVADGTISVLDWIMGMSENLIAQTIKANILHLAANLADEAFDRNHPFEDRQCNPFGRLLSVIIACFSHYEERLNKIAELPKDKQADQFQLVFKELSNDLLAKFFPHAAEDIQLFHHALPFVKLAKEFIWNKLNRFLLKELPVWLESLYHETKPLNEKENCQNWKENFDQAAYSLEAKQLLQLPSALLQHFIRNKRGRPLDAQIPAIEKALAQKGMDAQEANRLSTLLIKYTKEFLLTEDPTLHKMGAFFERYFMEHLLFNLWQFFPEENEDPLPFYMLKRWIEGNVFQMFSKSLFGTALESEDKIQAIQELLAPFGLGAKETFPLPPAIKEKAWPVIEKLLYKHLPKAILDNIPTWITLNKRKKHEGVLDDLLADSSLTDTVSNMTGTVIDKLFQTHSSSIEQKINELLPFLTLRKDQQEAIDQQWNALLEESDSMEILKVFGHHCLEALVLQLCKDLYDNYQKSSAIEGMSQLFREEGEEDIEASPPFAAWLVMEIIQACELLVLEGATEAELEVLRRAIGLKNALRNAKDTVQAKKDRAELDGLWLTIQPKFNHLCRHLLGILGYTTASDLPCPKKFQSSLWTALTTKASAILFEQAGNLMLPLLEKKALQREVEALPNGDLIKEGCQLLVQDIVQHLPKWLDGKMDGFLEKIVEKQPELKLSNKAKNDLTETLKSIVNGGNQAYEPIWKWMKSYLEGLFLKVVVRIEKMNQEDLQKIRILVQQTRDELLALKAEKQNLEQKLLIQFTDQFFAYLGIEAPQDLFGVPKSLQGPLLKEGKKKIAKVLLGLHQLDHRISRHVVKSNSVESDLPTSEVARAVFALTQYVLDTATDKLTERREGEVPAIPKIYDALNKLLSKQAGKGYEVAKVFQKVIARKIPTPFLVKLFEILGAPSAQRYKQDLVDWINPILTDQVIHSLAPLLEKERGNQAAFDQTLVMTVLPVITRHLKHLNQASQSAEGLNFESFLEAAKGELHSAVPSTKRDEKAQKQQAQKEFYDKQVELIFQLIFPNGKSDLKNIQSDFAISDKQLDHILESAKEGIALQLPKVLDFIFDKKTLTRLFTSFFEIMIKKLAKPIKEKSPRKKSSLTEEEKVHRREMDRLVGKWVIEAARFMDVPIGVLEKLPGWVKSITGINKIEKRAYESIGKLIRKKFDGELFVKTLKRALPKLAEKKHVKGKTGAKLKAPKDFKELEGKLAQQILAYPFRYVGAYFESATDIFTNPVLKFLRAAFLTTISFVVVTLLGSFFRFFKMERFVVNRLHDFIQHAREKTLNVLSQQDLHKDVIYHGVEAFESVLIGKPVK